MSKRNKYPAIFWMDNGDAKIGIRDNSLFQLNHSRYSRFSSADFEDDELNSGRYYGTSGYNFKLTKEYNKLQDWSFRLYEVRYSDDIEYEDFDVFDWIDDFEI